MRTKKRNKKATEASNKVVLADVTEVMMRPRMAHSVRIATGKGLNKHIKNLRPHVHHVTEHEILKRFCDIEDGGSRSWMAARRVVGFQYGLTDDTGRPLTAYARQVLSKGRVVHAWARREYLIRQKRLVTPRIG